MDGPTARDEWETYSEGYVTGMERIVGKRVDEAIAGAEAAVDRALERAEVHLFEPKEVMERFRVQDEPKG